MNNKLFVGNLSYDVTEEQLQKVFSQYGAVISAVLPRDRDSGRLRGFGFVEMETQADAEAAIKALDQRDLSGRALKVSMSTPKPRTSSRY
jgi:RNA recognition motif-containing protein